MNGKHFQEWFSQILVPALPANTVLVMDNALYTRIQKTQFPTKQWLKKDIRTWLTERGIPWDAEMIKQELLTLAEPHREECQQYFVDQIAKEAGHEVLHLPPYHCELNPFKMVWGFLKAQKTQQNISLKMEDVLHSTSEGFQRFTDMWPRYIEHVIVLEQEMWQLDGMMEEIIERIIINASEETSNEDENDDSDDTSE